MSKGSQVRGVRIDDATWMEIQVTISRRNMWTRGEPWDISKFVKAAIREKIDKMGRSRRRHTSASKRAIAAEIADLESVSEDFLTLTLEDHAANA